MTSIHFQIPSARNVQPLFELAGGTSGIDYIVPSSGDTPVPVQIVKARFDTRSILFCGLFTVLGTVAVYFVAGQALRPLRDLSGEVETVDENNLSICLPEAASHDEVSRLTDGFNRMLSRLDDAFLRQKRFTANAAHELKTPLAGGALLLAAVLGVLLRPADGAEEDVIWREYQVEGGYHRLPDRRCAERLRCPA